MILYYAPGACSLASHIALIEAGLPYELVSVKEKRTEGGRDYWTINPKGYTPALEFEDGTILTENLAILTYIADRSGKMLAGEGLDRWRVLEALAFMTSEIHGGFKPFFYRDAAQIEKARPTLVKRFAPLAEQLGDKSFLVGDRMTIADPYLFVMLTWAGTFEIEIPEPLGRYIAQMKQAPSVARALAEEGLV